MADLKASYAKAEQMLPHNMRSLILSNPAAPTWIADTDCFWYRRSTEAGSEVILVDAAAGTKELAFDHERMAKALSVVLETDVQPHAIPLTALARTGEGLRLSYGPVMIDVSLEDYSANIVGVGRADEALSPDGRWGISVAEHNLFLRDTSTDELRQLTYDGEKSWAYGQANDQVSFTVMKQHLGISSPPSVVWSPDSTRFLTHRLDQRQVGLMHLVRSAPIDGSRPQLLSYHYALPGDENVATAEYFVFDAASGSKVRAKLPAFDMPFVSHIDYGWVWWSQDLSKVYWLQNDRGDHHGVLQELDAATGEVRAVVTESSDSQILYGNQQNDCNVRTLSTGEVLWWSQRADWGHLYLYDVDGSARTLTSGPWGVRNVVLVDEDTRSVIFTAGGRDPSADLYVQQLCSVSLDGGEVAAITADGLDHHCYPSPSGNYFVDSTSRWDTPTFSRLRDRTGAIVLELEQADATGLYAAGWTAPERAIVTSADGVTDIYCSIYTPHDFDPATPYPVLDCIYPGPQMSCSPQRFPLSGGPLVTAYMAFNYPDAVAALGFVVVTIDGRGSAMRERSFQDHSRNPASPFVEDHVSAIKQLATARPWMDLDRVGIYGYSAGGFGSSRAFLQAPDFYKICVSGSGNHDNRLNHSWWGEKYFGLTQDYDFGLQANSSLADNLTGRLLLIHGEMDDNAVPHATMRLVKALIEANKDFDLLIIPNADHFMMVNREYFTRRRWDYFVRNLMGQTPPEGFQLGPMPTELAV